MEDTIKARKRRRRIVFGSVVLGIVLFILIFPCVYPVFPTTRILGSNMEKAIRPDSMLVLDEATHFSWDKMYTNIDGNVSLEQLGKGMGISLPDYYLQEFDDWMFFLKEGKLVRAYRMEGMFMRHTSIAGDDYISEVEGMQEFTPENAVFVVSRHGREPYISMSLSPIYVEEAEAYTRAIKG